MIVAIDGPAGSGKSTTARAVGSYLFAGGCLIGVAEGLPKSVIGPFKRFTNWDEFMA